MSVRRRRLVRGVPDNLGPLVDTLSNVVGILIMVIVVTRLELGEALDRRRERRSRRGRARSRSERTPRPARRSRSLKSCVRPSPPSPSRS
jgi:hypothetical protein